MTVMKTGSLNEAQIIGFLKQVEVVMSVKEVFPQGASGSDLRQVARQVRRDEQSRIASLAPKPSGPRYC